MKSNINRREEAIELAQICLQCLRGETSDQDDHQDDNPYFRECLLRKIESYDIKPGEIGASEEEIKEFKSKL